jgi:predicted short-subunit dehydrogenase-like oxidoreductase (DUF2520 family)
VPILRVIGPGRAGRSVHRALLSRGYDDGGLRGRSDSIVDAARDVDLLVIATPDAAIGEVADAVEPAEQTLVVHLSGSLGLDVLEGHPRRAALHPLVALPDEETGARRLEGAWFAVAGDPQVHEVVSALAGRSFTVDDEHRAAYHAAAVIASNHLVALLGQAERVAAVAGVPLDAYLDLVRATVDNVADLGPAAALTGPVARGDWQTIERHLEALHPDERPAYVALAHAARRLLPPGGEPGDEMGEVPSTPS